MLQGKAHGLDGVSCMSRSWDLISNLVRFFKASTLPRKWPYVSLTLVPPTLSVVRPGDAMTAAEMPASVTLGDAVTLR